MQNLELSYATQLTDITPLQNIPHLTFFACPNIQDFSRLSNKCQQSLLIGHSTLSDVSFLQNVLTVELYSCNQVVDVSPLHGIKNLRLIFCYNIEDISSLGNHHLLLIAECPSINRGFECFRSIRHATVCDLKVPDLGVFRDVKSLQITFYTTMESQFFLLKDIPELSFHIDSDRDGGYDISHLRNSRLSFYNDIIGISGNNFPSQLKHLKVNECKQIVKIIDEGKTSIFHHLQSLHISSCSIAHVNGLGDIPTLILERCFALHDISGLGRNRCLELRLCLKIRDVSSLTTVPVVMLWNCKGIVDYSCLSSVPRLKIVNIK